MHCINNDFQITIDSENLMFELSTISESMPIAKKLNLLFAVPLTITYLYTTCANNII